MCLIGWRVDPGSRWPLLLAANRDEAHDRATSPLQRWSARRAPPSGLLGPGSPAIGPDLAVVGGRDDVAGGTWLGLARAGAGGPIRIALLTNVRDGRAPPAPAGAASRGWLVTDLLRAAEPVATTMAALADAPGLTRLAGFNLVGIELTPRPGGWLVESGWLGHRGPGAPASAVVGLGPGVHGLSNGRLDEPWPKTVALKQAIAAAAAILEGSADPGATSGIDDGSALGATSAADDGSALVAIRQRLFARLADDRPAPTAALPDTGIDRERERLLSSLFIRGDGYGTRSSTVLAIGADGRFDIVERRFGPTGRIVGEHHEGG